MHIKVIPLCLGMGIGMVVMKVMCLKQESCEDQCLLDECKNGCSCDNHKEKGLSKAKEKINQVVSEIEKLEMSDVKVKTKEALGLIKEKILSIHL